jgi:hypothetical protein
MRDARPVSMREWAAQKGREYEPGEAAEPLPSQDPHHEELLAAVKTLREQAALAERKRLLAEAKLKAERERRRKGPLRMQFGSYKGHLIKDLPPDYARWLLGALREQNRKAGAFRYTNAVLGPELMKVVMDLGDLDEAVQELVARHQRKHPDFDAPRFLRGLGAGRRKPEDGKLQVLWMGVPFMARQMRRAKGPRRRAAKQP